MDVRRYVPTPQDRVDVRDVSLVPGNELDVSLAAVRPDEADDRGTLTTARVDEAPENTLVVRVNELVDRRAGWRRDVDAGGEPDDLACEPDRDGTSRRITRTARGQGRAEVSACEPGLYPDLGNAPATPPWRAQNLLLSGPHSAVPVPPVGGSVDVPPHRSLADGKRAFTPCLLATE